MFEAHNKPMFCKDGRMLPIKLKEMSRQTRRAINFKLRAYLNDDRRWMEPVSLHKGNNNIPNKFSIVKSLCFEV